jgi:uncharacterized membrane protein YccC
MSAFNKRSLIFGFNCYLAVVMALFFAYSLNLTNPVWAVLTVFITSQPFAGAIWSKALYRVMGTFIGAAAALVIIPTFVNTPIILMCVMASWVGFCLYISLLDRTPRSYIIMLAGYTAALVGLPEIVNPVGLFHNAIARVEEITIGVLCASLTHSLIFPVSVEGVVLAKINKTLLDGKNWLVSALEAEPEIAARRARRRIALDLTELTILGTNFKFEVIASRQYINAIRALEERLILLLPMIYAVEDRLEGLRNFEGIPDKTDKLIKQIKAWVLEHDINNIAVNKNLIELTKGVEQQKITAMMDQCRAIAVTHASSTAWKDILELNLVTRLIDLIQLWADSLALYAVVLEPNKKPSPILKAIVSINRRRPLHIDKGLAAYSGLTTVIATLVCATFVMTTHWTQGASAISLTAVMCCIFATADNPTVMQKKMFIATLIAFPVAFIYVFGIFPALDSFTMLALSLFPLVMVIGVYLANPVTQLSALSIGMITVPGIGFTSVPHTDFVTFFMGNLIAMVGVLMALVVTLLIRVISTETSIHRILRAGWKDLSHHAIGPYRILEVTWASVMLDRLGLLIPRVVTAPDSEQFKIDKALKGLPIGFNILDLRIAKRELPQLTQDKINLLMKKLSNYFLSMKRHGYRLPKEDLLNDIDVIINDILKIRSFANADRSSLFAQDPRLHGLIASVGLRRNLFPHAAAFQANDLNDGASIK